jgi:DNA repair protein SbcC/Rad50
MNKQNIINTAKGFFDTITSYKDNVYRAELKMGKEKTAAIYYIDVDQDVALDQFEEYQESLLAKDYYNEPGDIQWNYYLLLLRDQIQDDLKQKIEKNDKYARKYVFDETQFENFFKAERSAAGIELDFVGIIKQKLDVAGLHEVYGDKTYTATVDNFVNGGVAPASGKRRKIQSSEEKIRFINSLVLTSSYRPFPLKRDFEFKKVNLIEGINGTGKTSLMEALELSVCGKTYRNPTFPEVDGCVEVVFNNGEIQDKCIPTNNTKYRTRDFTWYASSYPTGNNLHQSFQRYNFFNTDAAQEFANSNNEQDIRKSLLNIILGTEYTYITERVKGFYNQFARVYSAFKKEYNNAVSEQSVSQQILDTTPVSANIESLTETILLEYKELCFLNNSWGKDSLPEIEKLNNALSTCVNQLKSYSREGMFSKADALDRIEKNQVYRNHIAEYNAYLSDLDKKMKQNATEINRLAHGIRLLSTALKYCKGEWLTTLKGAEVRLVALKDLNRKLEWALEKTKGINISAYRSDLLITEMVTQLSDELATASQVEKEIQSNIHEQLGGMKKKEALISEIKALGNRFIHDHPEATDCPLCHSSFTTSQLLRQKIEDFALGHDNIVQSQLDDLDMRLQAQKEIHANALKRKTEFETLLQVYKNLPSTSISAKANELVQYLSNVSIVLDRQKEEADSIQSLVDMAAIEQVSEKELLEIEEQLTIQFPDLILLNQNESQFVKKRSELEFREKELLAVMRQYESEQQSETEKFRQQLQIESESFNIQKLSEQQQITEGLLNTVMDMIARLEQLIDLKLSQNFESLSVQAETLGRNIVTLRAEQQNQFIINDAKKKKAVADAFIKEQASTKEKYDKAMQTLDTLNSETGNAQLVEFFKQNMAEVLDVFMTIHTPREFTNIVFKNNNLFLATEHGDERSVSQISTGQRSALALSIFITMNRKLKSGPNIIMFDDPVAFIDDLNALSFLDYLRYFVLREGKQIFFSTANARLADLFEKKFSFLENDFQKHPLKREKQL